MKSSALWPPLNPYIRLMRLDRPIGAWLLYWPTLIALFAAGHGTPSLRVLFGFSIGTVLMRSAGCVINDMADRDFDRHVQRTAQRPLASGELSRRQALPVLATLLALSAGLLLLFDLRTALWALPALALAMSYPFMKRFTYFPQVILGAAFSWSIPMAWVAQGQMPEASTWLLYAAALSWVVAYDTQYAMVDREDDLRIGVRSTAILFADMDLSMIAILQALFLLGLGLLAKHLHWGIPFVITLLFAAIAFVRQAWICRYRQRDACFKAFLENHYVGALLFAGVFLTYLIPGSGL
ncbi:MAG: 4-hydroxybenzoate octaprenyltransferase [Pseudomonadales bacterium]|nr:4-hydroxybenzoate octaprenyltransferase [Pseudomonadales bacterium]